MEVSESIEVSGEQLRDSLSSWPHCTAAILQQKMKDAPSFGSGLCPGVEWKGDGSSAEPGERRRWVPRLCLESPPSTQTFAGKATLP